MTRIRRGLLSIIVLPLATAGCTSSADQASLPSPSHAADESFVVSSADFADGGTLPESAKATAFGGQCSGENVSPAFSWTGAPGGTAAYAITVIDISADNFVHWTKADIPATTTEIPAGGADALSGVGGQTGNSGANYFGPCPPGPDHHYVVTVYALDAQLGLDANFSIGDLSDALSAHALAESSIVGLASKTS